MNWQRLWQIAKSYHLILVPILALAFYIAFIPKLNFPYPVHLDEWWHWAYSDAVLKAGSITFTDPLLGQTTKSLGSNLEIGFQVFWDAFQRISGIPWVTIIRYFPGVVFMFTVLSVYALAKRQGFGWEAAFFTCLITTTIGILGPGFFVPVDMALLFVPLSRFVLFNFRGWQTYVVILVFIGFLMVLHPPSAICALIIIGSFFLVNLKHDFKQSLGILLVLLILALVTVPWLIRSETIVSQAQAIFTAKDALLYHDLPHIITDYGLLPILICLLGVFILTLKRGRENYSLVLGLLALLVMLSVYYTLHYGIGIMYLRGLLFAMLVVGIFADAGLSWLRKLELPRIVPDILKRPMVKQATGVVLCLIIVGITLDVGIPARLKTPYYHMIDSQDDNNFAWIRDNVDASYKKAVLDPWKATAFSAITGHITYARPEVSAGPSEERAYAFLSGNCTDTSFLRENGISIVYTRGDCTNPELTMVREHVFLLK